MKQVIFAIALLAMASLTGCLTDDKSSDTTYKPNKNSNISIPFMEFTKTGNTVTSNCKSNWQYYNIQFTDTNSNVIWLLDGYRVRDYSDETYYGWEKCEDTYESKINIILPQEPVRVTVTFFDGDDYHLRTYAGTF